MQVVLISGHAPDAPRKTGFHFWARILGEHGHDVDWITVGLSRLTFLKPNARSYTPPFNEWVQLGPHFRKYTWCPPFHPLSLGHGILNALTMPLFNLYPHLLPQEVKDRVRTADLFIVESGAGPALVPMLAKLCPNASFVYNFSDRFNVVKWHPSVPRAHDKALPYFTATRVNAAVVANDFPRGTNVQYVPQAIEKSLFDNANVNPYNQQRNVISVGDMLFDAQTVAALANAYPDWTFHLFGRQSRLEDPLPNVIAHGEVSFETLVPYLKFADIGLAPYRQSPDADYLSQSSLKLVQYTYCQLPIVAPAFAAAGRPHVMAYDAANPSTAPEAFARAIAYDRRSINKDQVMGWKEMTAAMLALGGKSF